MDGVFASGPAFKVHFRNSGLTDKSWKVRSAAQSALNEFNEMMVQRELERKLQEEYDEIFGILQEDDEFWKENEEDMEMYFQDVDKLDGNNNEYLFDEDDTNDELPF